MEIPSAIPHNFMGKTFSHTPYGFTKFAGKTFSSDLRKLTAVSKSLSKFKNKISVIEKIIWYIETNRMRNLHLHKVGFVDMQVGVRLGFLC